jgi:uncharacterized repeat protein (TIGR03803 family)
VAFERHYQTAGVVMSDRNLNFAFSHKLLGLFLVLSLSGLGSGQQPAVPEIVIYSFAGAPDGMDPEAGLLRDSKGNLFGTTETGGASGYGTVFGVNPAGAEKVLYSFSGGADGGNPTASLVQDSQGSLYGTTFSGGTNGNGTVFKLSLAGVESVLYRFTGGTDGSHPRGGVVRDSQGNLYGTTGAGGNFGMGVVYKVTPGGLETVLHSFNFADGSGPQANLILDSQANLYGTTTFAGSFSRGTVFKVTTAGSFTSLYNFGSNFPDGANPKGALIRDAQGNLYGTTENGGTLGAGTVYELTPTGAERVIYNFSGGADGGMPEGALVRDGLGNLYGTTIAGGNTNCAPSCGVVYELTAGGQERVLYSFDTFTGAAPNAGLTPDGKGGAYGTTTQGGANFSGTVYRVGP